MASDDVMAVDQSLTRLEKTVATGFFEHGRRMDRLEDRMSSLESKLDVVAEAIRGDIKNVVEVLTSVADEMRRTTVEPPGT